MSEKAEPGSYIDLVEVICACSVIPKDDTTVLKHLLFRAMAPAKLNVRSAVKAIAAHTRVSSRQVDRILRRWGPEGLKVLEREQQQGPRRAATTFIKKQVLRQICLNPEALRARLSRLGGVQDTPGGRDAVAPGGRDVTTNLTPARTSRAAGRPRGAREPRGEGGKPQWQTTSPEAM